VECDLTFHGTATTNSATQDEIATQYRENRLKTAPAGRLRLVHSADRFEPGSAAGRLRGSEEVAGPVIRIGGFSDEIRPTPTEETTPA
jgi:hypothetical protein